MPESGVVSVHLCVDNGRRIRRVAAGEVPSSAGITLGSGIAIPERGKSPDDWKRIPVVASVRADGQLTLYVQTFPLKGVRKLKYTCNGLVLVA